VVQRAEVNPVRLNFGKALEFLVGEIDEIVGDGPYDAERGLAFHVEFDFRGAGGFVFQHLHELGGHGAAFEQVEGLAATVVGTDSAERIHFVAQLLGVGREVQWRSAQIFVLADHVPKNLANANDAHRVPPGPNFGCRYSAPKDDQPKRTQCIRPQIIRKRAQSGGSGAFELRVNFPL
jgi:hypothetical protein